MAKHTPTPSGEQDMASGRSPRRVAHTTRQHGTFTERRLGSYHLRELLGFGGMADVYRAYDLILMRDVAVKVLASELAEDAAYVDRFRTEARRVAALSHPHLVPVYHAGEDTIDGQRLLYLVMPLLHESLEDVLQREGKLPSAEAVSLVLQIADGLQAAHEKGLIHRDVKPGNILLDAEGQALLADFGLAREVRRDAREITRQPWGTPEYMAPEQLQGGASDQRADIYALGVVLYELLAGKRPFDGTSAYGIAAQALNGPLKLPSAYESAVSPELDRVVLTALARERDGRYPSMAAFASALRQAVSQHAGKAGDFAAATTVPLPDHFWSSPHSVLRASRWRSLKWMLALALASAMLVVTLGLALPPVLRHWQDPHDPANALGQGPVAQASPTSAGSLLLPDQTPLPTPTTVATNTPYARPVATATATAHAVSTLTIAPTPLVLTPSTTNPKTCIATQTITNNTGSSVTWAWQKPQVSGFHFVIDGKPSVGWPIGPYTTSPGTPSSLVVTADCKPAAVSSAILVTDSLGNQYTFIMTLQ